MNRFNLKFLTIRDKKKDCKKLIQYMNMFPKKKVIRHKRLTQSNNILIKKAINLRNLFWIKKV